MNSVVSSQFLTEICFDFNRMLPTHWLNLPKLPVKNKQKKPPLLKITFKNQESIWKVKILDILWAKRVTYWFRTSSVCCGYWRFPFDYKLFEMIHSLSFSPFSSPFVWLLYYCLTWQLQLSHGCLSYICMIICSNHLWTQFEFWSLLQKEFYFQ